MRSPETAGSEGGAASRSASGASADRPNVAVIVLDTARRDRVSAYGYDRETTPNFDRFAADATLYADPVAQAPWSVPSHATLFTGRYPEDHGASTIRPIFDAPAPLPERLRRAGYETYAISTNEYVRPATGFARGFDEFHGPTANSPGASAAAGVSRLAARLGPLAESVTASGLRRPLEAAFNAVNRRKRPTPVESADDDWLLARAGSVLARASEPYFLFVNLTDAHLPRSPAPAARDRLVEAELRETPVIPTERAHALRDGLPARELAAIDRLYDADLRTADARLGELLGMIEDGLVIVVSDHGEHLGEFGLLGHQYSVFDPVVSVPLAISFPAGEPDRSRVDEQVEIRRLYHTVLDAAGVASFPEQSLASATGDARTRGSFASPMVDVERLLREGTFAYDRAHLGRRLSFVRKRSEGTKRIRYGDRAWLFDLPEDLDGVGWARNGAESTTDPSN